MYSEDFDTLTRPRKLAHSVCLEGSEDIFSSIGTWASDAASSAGNALSSLKDTLGGLGPLAVAGGSLAGGLIQANATRNASQAQVASNQAAQAQIANQFGITRNDLLPFITGGTDALRQMAAFHPELTPEKIAQLTAPFDPSNLENTPGYQFTLGQGLKAVQNSAAAKGLGNSPQALRGAAQYTTGLADTTYGNQFTRYLQENQQNFANLLNMDTTAFNRLLGRAQIGGSVGGTLANAGSLSSSAIANALIGAGTAQAAGSLGTANALSGGLQGISQALLLGQLMRQQPQNQPGTPLGANPWGMPTGVSGFGYTPSDISRAGGPTGWDPRMVT